MKLVMKQTKRFSWINISLNILLFPQVLLPTCLSKESSETGPASKTFFLNGRHHELPEVQINFANTVLEDGVVFKVPVHPNFTVELTGEPLFRLFVKATYPLYIFYEVSLDPNVKQWLPSELVDSQDATAYFFRLRWIMSLSHAKWKNSSIEFRSNVAPFFGISLHHFYDVNDDAVYFYKSADIPDNYKEYFRRFKDGKTNTVDDCKAYLFIDQKINPETGVSERMYSCMFQDERPGHIYINIWRLNIVPIFLNAVIVAQKCVQWCENNAKCNSSAMWIPPQNKQWSSYGYCVDPANKDPTKIVYFPSIYASLPQGKNQTPEIYFNLEDVRFDKMIAMDPIEKYHEINSTVDVTCTISTLFLTKAFQFALKYKQIEELDYLPVQHKYSRNAFDIIETEQTTTYRIKLDRGDIDRIFCFAHILGSFRWTNTSLGIQVPEPSPPTFIHDGGSERIGVILETSPWTFSIHKEFALGSTNETLNCRATGEPSPEITWTWNHTKVRESKGEYRPHQATWSQLSFQRIYKTTAGEYSCTATNPHGVARTTFNVFITDESATSSLVLWIGGPVIVFALIGTIIFAIILIKREKRSAKLLTKIEYQDFLYGSSTKNKWDPNAQIFSKALPPKLIISQDSFELDVESVLGSGQYGVVMKGWLKCCKTGKTVVAVKTTKSDADILYVKALISEVKIMAYIGEHKNIVGFFGACIENLMRGEIHVLLEFCENGNLLGRLRKEQKVLLNSVSEENYNEISPKTLDQDHQIQNLPTNLLKNLFQWSRNIANGMAFISSKNVIHGDLAARNVLLTKDNVAKISDFGLSRLLLNDYSVYTKKTNVPLPWKWMALESLTEMKFSVQSDAWAFGITLWEIFSLGDSPYPGCKYNKEFMHRVATGFCPPQPKYASQEVYKIMHSCWNVDPQMRPQMSSVCNLIAEEQLHLEKVESVEKSNVVYIDPAI